MDFFSRFLFNSIFVSNRNSIGILLFLSCFQWNLCFNSNKLNVFLFFHKNLLLEVKPLRILSEVFMALTNRYLYFLKFSYTYLIILISTSSKLFPRVQIPLYRSLIPLKKFFWQQKRIWFFIVIRL